MWPGSFQAKADPPATRTLVKVRMLAWPGLSFCLCGRNALIPLATRCAAQYVGLASVMKYSTLINILDAVRLESPAAAKRYRPGKAAPIEQLNQARALAYIHLYLKVKFGILGFAEREKLITDGSQDGGIDAYYIDSERKVIYEIQSKFRTTEANYEGKEITLDELMAMDIGLIVTGKIADSRGNNFNDAIRDFQKKLQAIPDIALYEHKVVLLANLERLSDDQIRKIVGNFSYEIVNFASAYNELVFPVCTGTYYNPDQIEVRIDLAKKNSPQLSQEIDTPYGSCELRIIYVPISEIAKAVSRYKNALLKYNPRNFLSLSRNPVNQDIQQSALSDQQNMFALLNNGITILCSFASMTDRTGAAGVGQLVIKMPQIINGGQTASSLAAILDAKDSDLGRFAGKEVLLKIISTPQGVDQQRLLEFIETISDATNQQTRVVEADRRANDPRMLEIQKYFYDTHGLFLEKKRGEFSYGLKDGYISKAAVVDRTDLIRNYRAFTGGASKARGSVNAIFETSEFSSLLDNFDVLRIFLSYACMTLLAAMVRQSAATTRPAYTISHAKFGFLTACGVVSESVKLTDGNVGPTAKRAVDVVVSKWNAFEALVAAGPRNAKYIVNSRFNYDNYFKGEFVDSDLRGFFRDFQLS